MKRFAKRLNKSMIKNLVVLFVAMGLIGCGKKESVITELSYTECVYKMVYDYFDGEETYQFEISENKDLYVKAECTEGSLGVKVVNVENEELYKEELLVSKDTIVEIPREGRYIIVLTGKETTGSIYMEVVDEK